MIDLKERNIIVTGAASGIGKETAYVLNELGASLLLLDINEEALRGVAKTLGESARYAVVDLTKTEDVKEIVKESVKWFDGGFSGMVHCAGIPSVVPLRALNDEQYERVQRINVQAGLNLAKVFSSKGVLDRRRQGAIVFISSVYGIVGSSCNVAYSISKAAVVGMSKSLAMEFVKKDIRVNCIAPGFIKTEMMDGVNNMFDANYQNEIAKLHPMGLGEAKDIANGIAFLLSDASKWITGSVLNIDGGFTAQ